MRRSGDGARGALGIACPAAVCAHVHRSNEQARDDGAGLSRQGGRMLVTGSSSLD